MVKGLDSVASINSHECSFNSSVGIVPDTRITGKVMSSERTFLISSSPVTLGIL